MVLTELCLYMSSNSHMKLRIKLHVESMKLKLRFQLPNLTIKIFGNWPILDPLWWFVKYKQPFSF